MRPMIFSNLLICFLIILPFAAATGLAATGSSEPAMAANPAIANGQAASPGELTTDNRDKLATLFRDPVTPELSELPSGALSRWRDFRGQKPALLLLSNHPFLAPIPADDRQAIRTLIASGPDREVIRRGRNTVADTLFISPQTVSVAIDNKLIGEIIFVWPTPLPLADFSLEQFQSLAVNAGFLSSQEAAALSMDGGGIKGVVRGIPFRCVHPDALPEINRPVLVHIDLGFFKNLFVNEIKTPLYTMLTKTASDLRDHNYRVLAVTLSYSNQEADFSLSTRFMISNLAELVRHPALLNGGGPACWRMRAEAMFSKAMFLDSRSRELVAKAVEACPDDPDALYALSIQDFGLNRPAAGFKLLDQAVRLDPGYAKAYYGLAQTGIDLNRAQQSIALLDKAASVFKDDPFLRLQLADLLVQSGQPRKARVLLDQLMNLNWSTRYHPGIQNRLNTLAEAARVASQAAEDSTTPSLPTSPTKP